jgi:hypothetical protein
MCAGRPSGEGRSSINATQRPMNPDQTISAEIRKRTSDQLASLLLGTSGDTVVSDAGMGRTPSVRLYRSDPPAGRGGAAIRGRRPFERDDVLRTESNDVTPGRP